MIVQSIDIKNFTLIKSKVKVNDNSLKKFPIGGLQEGCICINIYFILAELKSWEEIK